MPGKWIRVGQAERHGRRWRVAKIDATGGREPEYFATEDEARSFVVLWRARSAEHTVATAVDARIEHLRRYGGSKRRPLVEPTLKKVRSMLEGFLQLVDPELRKANRGARRPAPLPLVDRPLRALTAKVAAGLYRDRVNSTKSNGEPISADTHRSELDNAHAAAAWWVEQGWLKENPFAHVLPEGTLSKGKAQLRLEESRRFISAAYSDKHPTGGLAAASVLTLGVRASELLERRVRDLDDAGRVLWIPFGKTEAARRRVAIPPVLRAALVKLADGQGPEAYLFGTMTSGTLLDHVARLCATAGVPRVCTHGLRGTQISLTVEVGTLVTAASKGAGHAATGVTRRHYLAAGVEQSARAALMEEILLTDSNPEAEAADLAAAEAEVRAANEKLERLRGAKVSPRLGIPAKTAYPNGQSGDLTN